MYSRLSEEAAKDYDKVKIVLMKRYDLTNLATHLRERAPETLAKIAKIADQYLEAHGKHLFSPASRKPIVPPERDEGKNMQINPPALHCFKCNTRGHKAVNCPTMAKKCFLCGKQGHKVRNCHSGGWRSGGQSN